VSGLVNPVLRGFRPDPSLLRIGADWWIATSTFEWWPGVALHHGRDLSGWELVGGALDRRSQLELRNLEPSCGVWAPDLSVADGVVHLVYTVVLRVLAPFLDSTAMVVTAADPRGPWSEPTFLLGYGFDHSLFHDDDGSSWLLWTVLDLRPGRPERQRGIYARVYDRRSRSLHGPAHRIFGGTELGSTEGPHLYRRDDWYYLVTAEGGTYYDHAVTVARSRHVLGPYQISPHGPMLTSAPHDRLQRAGHASLAEAADGSWWAAHLVSRPLPPAAEGPALRSPLGRETALQQLSWPRDGWPTLAAGGCSPRDVLPLPAPDTHPVPAESGDLLGPRLLTLREPPEEQWVSSRARPGWVRLRGRASLSARQDVSLLAHRVTELRWSAEVEVEAIPASPWQACGLLAFYDGLGYAWLRLSAGPEGGRELCAQTSGWLWYDEPGEPVTPPDGPLHLGLDVDGAALTMRWSADGSTWQRIGPLYDASRLSDEFRSDGHFTGTVVGVHAVDLMDRTFLSDWRGFAYRPNPPANATPEGRRT